MIECQCQLVGNWVFGFGSVTGSNVAIAKNCKCPVIDNAEMPDDRKWVNGDCPIHGKVK